MSLPAAGLITLAMLAAEFGGSQPYAMSQFYRGGGRVTGNNTNVPASGAISLSNFYGAVKVVPGSASYTTPGTYTFIVPPYTTLTADVRGAGGGGAGSRYTGYYIYYGDPGTVSYFNAPTGNVVGNGGSGGSGSNWNPPVGGVQGAHGTASGGDSNITGGGSPGGQGSIITLQGSLYGGPGGYGGRAVKSWSLGQLAPGTAITVVVGAGGAASPCEPVGITQYNTAGANGAVYLSWS